MANENKISPLNALNGIGLEKPAVPFEVKGGSRLNKQMAIFAVNQLAANFPEGKEALETAQKAGYSICLHPNLKHEFVNPADKTINVNANFNANKLQMSIMEHAANAAIIANGKLMTKYAESLIESPSETWVMSLQPYGAMFAEGKAYAAVAMDCMKQDPNAQRTLYLEDPYLAGLLQEFKDYHNADRKGLMEAAIGYHMSHKEVKEQAYYSEACKKNKTALKMMQAGVYFKVNPEKAKSEIEAEKQAKANASNAAVKLRIHAHKQEKLHAMKLSATPKIQPQTAQTKQSAPHVSVLTAMAEKKNR